ncbi:DUF6214 family protein [Streptomyces catenulae]|uniref:DUF6214 family protein n=1 Tax=Streptomyces catenulae TaxID=66875 RepID=A0ABV2YSG4_9ACTN|nr:DUF6214 family protein [Streptomyces catenulae]
MSESDFYTVSERYEAQDARADWPAWELRGHGSAAPPRRGADDHPEGGHPLETAEAPPRLDPLEPWVSARLTFADGARIDVLVTVEDDGITVEDLRADPPLPLSGLATLAHWIEGPLDDACRIATGRTRRARPVPAPTADPSAVSGPRNGGTRGSGGSGRSGACGGTSSVADGLETGGATPPTGPDADPAATGRAAELPEGPTVEPVAAQAVEGATERPAETAPDPASEPPAGPPANDPLADPANPLLTDPANAPLTDPANAPLTDPAPGLAVAPTAEPEAASTAEPAPEPAAATGPTATTEPPIAPTPAWTADLHPDPAATPTADAAPAPSPAPDAETPTPDATGEPADRPAAPAADRTDDASPPTDPSAAPEGRALRGRSGDRSKAVAEAYRAAQRDGRDPVEAVMSATGRGRRRALRLIAGARDAGLLSPRHHKRPG